ncbi:DUF1552 domain-containing protein [Rubinisphaera sp.]|uniref:DUF1552 domain-containing protein n=1 Tax=Rubinisphaera sp. TaxID=2024857 RepID=UPI000C0D089C|nr:DUF1552 domain-containing protein [Rubinisphaera sp.]MBV09057.1 hypothetical protein [Rubinisphaera sp.]HCS51127.1 hypothetical protein [Planctomycetaceae bacterium]|tara:strand:+ start:7922 stop:9265 length:1344 start_codon:yes stop_codon:yes gene_type:complete
MTHSWLIDRRHVLRGLGSFIALPLLNCMRPLHAAETEETPRRSAFVYIPNGVNTLDYQITTAGKDYTFSRSLKPLEKHRSVVTPISGLHHPGGLGHHHNCQKIWLTGGQLGPTDRNTISVDQQMAEVTSPHTRFHSLEISNKGESLAWTADGIRLPGMSRCSEIFAYLFEEPKNGTASQRRELRRKGSVLDANLEEVRSLERKMGVEDKGRMNQYLTAVRETEIRTKRADAWLDVPRPKISDKDRQRNDRDVPQTQAGDYFRTVYDLIVLAFQTDATRVVTFSSGLEGQGLAIPELGISQSRHELSHHNGDAGHMEKLTQSDTFSVEQFSYFLSRLADTPDLNGRPLLDTTMSLFGSGMAYGHSHGNANLPLVLAGGTGCGFKHGRHLDLNQGHFDGYQLDDPGQHYRLCSRPANTNAHMSNLLLTMAQKMGVETERFADSNSELEL